MNIKCDVCGSLLGYTKDEDEDEEIAELMAICLDCGERGFYLEIKK